MTFFRSRSLLFAAAAVVCAMPACGAGISFTCDSSIGADFRAGTCNYLNTTVAALYGSTFTNANASVYIEATNNGLAASTTGYFNLVSYSTYQTALQAQSSDAAKAFVPATEPGLFGSSGDVSITSALAQALGITSTNDTGGYGPVSGTTASGDHCSNPGTGGCYNGIIYINDPTDLSNQYGQGYTYESLGGSTNGTTYDYDFFSVIEHEMDEILGSSSCIGLSASGTANNCVGSPSAVDLFRYSGAGVRAYGSQDPTDQYFSADGGVTDPQGNLYNTLKPGEDWADFSQGCVFVQDAEGCPSTDPSTNSFSILNDGPGGTVGPEVAILNAVGYNLTSNVPTETPEPSTMLLFGSALAGIGFYRRRRA